MSKTHLSDTAFTDFKLPEPLMRGILESGFEQCTPIQATTLPLTLAGEDIAGQARRVPAKRPHF